EKLWIRLETKRVDLSSSERTMAPSDLLLNSSNKPGNPVTAMILLYSMLTFWDIEVSVNRVFTDKKFFTAKLHRRHFRPNRGSPDRCFFSALHSRCIPWSAGKILIHSPVKIRWESPLRADDEPLQTHHTLFLCRRGDAISQRIRLRVSYTFPAGDDTLRRR